MANQGTLHSYTPKLVAFEHANPSTAPNTKPSNIILWIGGLGDGLLTVRYPKAIASSLPADWCLAEVLLSSSYKGWATGSLKRDARELGDCVAYFKKTLPGRKIVLMGHSTGCQDIMEYLVGAGHENRPVVDGLVLQGGVSDREAWVDMMERSGTRSVLDGAIEKAKKLIEDGREKAILPVEDNIVAKEFGAPITAYRTYSLVAKGGDDDYFSSDLEDSTLQDRFGKIPKSTPLMFLLGSQDPYVPQSISKEGLLGRWTKLIRAAGGVVDDVNGGVVPGAHHNLNDDPEEVVQDLVQRVVRFCDGLTSENNLGASLRL